MSAPHTIIIAEAGVNHDGSLSRALELVDHAAAAGADFVKFQTFDAAKLASARAPMADYQVRNGERGEGQLEMLRRLQLSHADHHALIDRCKRNGIRFLSSPFDEASLDFLIDDLGLGEIKLGSGELTNAPLIYAAARRDVELILSTGMATLGEIEEALGVIALARLDPDATPGQDAFRAALARPEAHEALRLRVTLLHCTTEYPAPDGETNLRAMDTLRAAFDLPVGFSDHTMGITISLAAVARGAVAIEKHFTISRDLPGPDHAASLEPAELTELVRQIRRIETALGSGVKQPGASELRNRDVARKSVVATRDLPAGTVLTLEDLGVKRPGGGTSPMMLWDLIGTRTIRDIARDEPL
jgi:N-acetylneuraminate synthase